MKVLTLQRLFYVLEEDHAPSRLTFQKPTALPLDQESSMLALAPRELWQQLFISKAPTALR